LRLSLVFFFFLLAGFDSTLLNLIKDDLVGICEGLFETGVEGVVANSALGLLGTASLGSLVSNSGLAGSLTGLGSDDLVGSLSAAEGVQFLHHVAVLEWVLLALVMDANGGLDGIERGLDLVRVDDSGKIGAVHGVTLELVASLFGSFSGVGTENVIKFTEGRLGEDNESTDMTTRGKLEEVESVDVASINTGEVSCGSLHVVVLIVVHKKGSLSHGETRVTVLSMTIAHLLGLADTVEVSLTSEDIDGLEESASLLGVEGVTDKRKFGGLHDTVTAGKNKRGTGRGGEGRSDGVSLLVDVDLAVPFSPDLEGSEHASLTALVTESGLA